MSTLAAPHTSYGGSRLLWPAIAIGVGTLVGLLPWQVGLPLGLAGAALILSIARPRLAVYGLALASPLATVAELRLGGIGITATDGLIVLALAGLSLQIARDRSPLAPPWALAGVGLFVGLALLSTGWIVSASLAVKEIVRWAQLGLMIALVPMALVQRSHALRFTGLLLLGGAIEGILGAYQFAFRVGPPSFEVGRFFRAHGTYGQPNPFAGYMEMVLPVALALGLAGILVLLRAPTRPSAAAARFPRSLVVLALGVATITGAALAMSYSRGAWIGLAAGLLAMVLFSGRRAIGAVGVVSIAALLIGSLGLIDLLPASVSDRFVSITRSFGVFDASRVVPTAETWAAVERMAHWQAAWEMFLSQPLRGVGIGQYVAVYADFHIPPWIDPLGHAHNYYLNVLAELGVPGLVLYIGMLAGMVLTTVRAIGAAHDPVLRALAVGILGVLVATAAHNAFDNLYVAGMNVHLGALVGLAVAVGRISRRVVDSPHFAP